MTVFVKWDPLHKKVVCVHSEYYGTCPACIEAQNKLHEAGCFLIEDWMEFEVKKP